MNYYFNLCLLPNSELSVVAMAPNARTDEQRLKDKQQKDCRKFYAASKATLLNRFFFSRLTIKSRRGSAANSAGGQQFPSWLARVGEEIQAAAEAK